MHLMYISWIITYIILYPLNKIHQGTRHKLTKTHTQQLLEDPCFAYGSCLTSGFDCLLTSYALDLSPNIFRCSAWGGITVGDRAYYKIYKGVRCVFISQNRKTPTKPAGFGNVFYHDKVILGIPWLFMTPSKCVADLI